MEQKQNTITDIINELKRLQVEHGDVLAVRQEDDETATAEAWPTYNEKANRIEF